MHTETTISPEAQAYTRSVIDNAARDRIPELFSARHPNALYHLPDRNGIGVSVLRASDLTEEQFVKLLRYRLAQYLAVGMFNAERAYAARAEYEPPEKISPNEIYMVSGVAETGEILCSASLWAVPDEAGSLTLRDPARPLFPVEEAFGWGIFNRLRILPDMRLGKIREIKRFVKNQQRPALDELGARGPIELGLGLYRALIGPLRMEVDACLGDLEEGVAFQNLLFFHAPTVIIHGGVPYEPDEDLISMYKLQNRQTFAFLVSDLDGAMRTRLPAIEAALQQPGKQGLMGLFALKRDIRTFKSSLEPAGGLEPLIALPMPQKELGMPVRRAMLDFGDVLRGFDLFRGLAPAEAATLGSFMQRIAADAGAVIVRQGEPSDALYLIEAGEAEAVVHTRTGEPVVLDSLGPGDYFGEIGLLTGDERTADVVACTPVKLLKLSAETYTRYLAHMIDVDQHMATTATRRASQTMRKLR